jgi:predicted membrane protein
MENMDNPQPYNRRSKSAWVGIVILCAGVLLLLRRTGVLIPGWIFSWPIMMIVIGLVIGANSGFRNPTSLIMILIGAAFLARHQGWIPFGLGQFFWPVGIIIVGLVIIVRPRRSYRMGAAGASNWQYSGSAETSTEDVLDSISIFTGVRRNISSKNFKRGEAVNIFGGTELNFNQADINGTAVLDAVVIFGGMKIFVPADWEVQVNVVHIFGGTDDKRQVQPSTGSKKILIITGTVIFGGIDIRSY